VVLVKRKRTETKSKKEKLEKIDTNYRTRLKSIRGLSKHLSKVKTIDEANSIGEEILMWCDINVLKSINSAIDDYKEGKFTTIKKFEEELEKLGEK